MTRSLLGGLLLWTAGCGSSDDPSPLGSGAPPPIALTLSVDLAPGEEATWCRHVPVGRKALEVGRFSHSFTGTSHHAIVYELDSRDGPPKSEPFRCDRMELPKARILYAPEDASGELVLPRDVVFRVPAGAGLLLEWHLVNTNESPTHAELSVELSAPAGPFRMLAGELNFYHPAIVVPAGGVSRARMRCELPRDVTLLWAASHQHALATKFSARVLNRAGTELATLLEGGANLPVSRTFEGGLRLERGQVVEVECGYENPTNRHVIEGPSTDDEMCMFVGTYFPLIDIPLGDGCLGGPVFDGNLSCAQSLECLNLAVDGFGREKCWTRTSAAHSQAFLSLVGKCAPAHCAESCDPSFGSEACVACLTANCAAEHAACLASRL